MTLTVKKGNIFDHAGIKMCPVNTKGTMGNGLAYAFKLKYPDVNKAYIEHCKQGQLTTSNPILEGNVLLFCTKDDWKNDSKLSYLEDGFKYIAENYVSVGLKGNIGIPLLGTGKGKLPIEEVTHLMLTLLDNMEIEFTLYLPDNPYI